MDKNPSMEHAPKSRTTPYRTAHMKPQTIRSLYHHTNFCCASALYLNSIRMRPSQTHSRKVFEKISQETPHVSFGHHARIRPNDNVSDIRYHNDMCRCKKNYPIIYKHKVIPYRYDTDGTMTADIYCRITAKMFLMRLRVFTSFQY